MTALAALQQTEDLETYRRVWQDERRRRAEHHLLWPSRPYREDLSILVAGCGTSQAARYALRWPAAQVTGIDISAESIRSTAELQRTHDLTNLRLYQMPIDRVRELETRFDLIVCTGALHNVADPHSALAALRDVLERGGAMHLMVYASYGRTGIYMVQEFCRRAAVRATDQGIRDLVTALRLLPPGHPLQPLLQQAPDFRDEAALADALLHPQDRAYSVPQLLALVDGAELVFGRWMRQAAYSARCGVMAQLPQSGRLSALPLPAQYAAVELFRGTMVRHNVVVHGRGGAGHDDVVTFAGDAWRDYVPVRLPNTACVQQRVPPGGAAVLINQSHGDRDLVMPLDATEKRMFDAIDGATSIRAIVDTAVTSAPEPVLPDLGRAFFERLWWHDQVVFDTTSIPS